MPLPSSLYSLLTSPEAFYRGTTNFWDDPHISEQLLKAHLDPDFEGASRKPEFINQSTAWLTHIAKPSQYTTLLDIGCGPGLYAERLHDKGYRVTGIDFSRRSIEYAAQHAKKTGRSITYHYQNYLAMNFHEVADVAILIYCDYGALSPEEGRRLLGLVNQSLRPGGKLVLDVFTPARLALFREKRTWERHEKGGFWHPGSHMALQEDCRYDNHTTLEQTIVISPDAVQPYYIWQRYFTPEMLLAELANAGFHNPAVYGDVAGRAWDADSETLAVAVEKE